MKYFKLKEEENRSLEEQEEESRRAEEQEEEIIRADEQEEDLFSDRQLSEKESCSVFCSTVQEHIKDMGSFASNLVKTIKEDGTKNGTVDLKVMCKSIAKQVATLFEALSTVIAHRDSSNNAV